MAFIDDSQKGLELETAAMRFSEKVRLMQVLVLLSLSEQIVDSLHSYVAKEIASKNRAGVSAEASPLRQAKAHIGEASAMLADLSMGETGSDIDTAISMIARVVAESPDGLEKGMRELDEQFRR